MLTLQNKGLLDRIVLDECHVIEKWGETFRKACNQTKLGKLKEIFPNDPLLAQTATIKPESRI